MKNSLILLLVSFTLLTACQTEGSSHEEASLEGTWLRPISGSPAEFEGIRFDADGSFGLINIYSMSGSSWKQTGKQLSINTLTERYPEVEPGTLVIDKLTASKLVLSGDGFFAGSYFRDNNAGGVITGSLSLPDNTALPADAVLIVHLEDVSLADAPSKLAGNRVIPVGGKSSPVSWRVYYPGAVIDTRNNYSISAVISYAGKPQFRTTSHYRVISDEMPTNIDIEVIAVNPDSAVLSKPMQGMYNYMADAGMFFNCADQQSYPVAMEAANASLERAYSEIKPGVNEKIWVEVIGQLVERADMEGNGSGLNLLVEELISISNDKKCPASSGSLTGKQWQLIAIFNSKLPAGINLSSANLEFSTAGKVSGSGGCNRLNADYTTDNNNSLNLGPVMMTRMACQGKRGLLETAFTAALDRVDSFTLAEGSLLLLSEGEPVLKFMAGKQKAFSGKWRLSKLAGLSIPEDINPGEVAYLEFMEDGMLSGKTGCNGLSSSYVQNENKLKFGMSAGTMMACPPDLMQIETAMHKVLAQTDNFEISDNTLILKDQQGSPLAWLKQ